MDERGFITQTKGHAMHSTFRAGRLDAPLSAPRNRPMRWIDAVFSTYRQRTQLSRLDTRMLRDVGLSESDVRGEVNRRFWDIPDWWR